MIEHDAFAIEPWRLRQVRFSDELVAQAESLFALGNGYLGLRGNLEEGAPARLHGTYLAGFHETRPMPYPERGYGDPEADEVVVNVSDGKRLHLMVGSEPLDLRAGSVLAHERALELRSGVLWRALDWRSPSGVAVRLRTRRLVSLVHRELAAIEYEVEPTEAAIRLTLHSDLVADETNPVSGDPRAGASLEADTLRERLAQAGERRAVLVGETRGSRLRVAAGMDHLIAAAAAPTTTCGCEAAVGRFTITADAAPGAPLRLVKLLAYHWSDEEEPQVLATATRRSLDLAGELGFEGLAAAQEEVLAEFWRDADVVLEGDEEIQQALRFGLFHLFQAAAQASGRAIPAKGLTGSGYSGHAFWDTEAFVLPVLTYAAPRLAREALRWRASKLPEARARARTLGLRGAAFPWRTITGTECSGFFPAGAAAFHVNADIADAAVRHQRAAGDESFEREVAAPLLVETARLWASLGFHDERRGGRFSITGVTGPDEYSALVHNNLYTNLMAQANLRAAAELAERLGHGATGADPEESAAWRRAADAMALPYDSELGVHLQDEHFADQKPWDFAGTPPERYPLLLHFPYLQLYRKQVVKQPDLVLAMHLHSAAFSPEHKRRNFAHYEPLTVRDSSLSACTNAVLAIEVGHLALGLAYLSEAALMDLHDLQHNTTDGLHLASLAGGWIAAIGGLAGLREDCEELRFAPRLPPPLRRLTFTLLLGSRRLCVEVAPDHATYRLDGPGSLVLRHHEKAVTLSAGQAVTAPIPEPPDLQPPAQPPGRAPARPRRAERGGG